MKIDPNFVLITIIKFWSFYF